MIHCAPPPLFSFFLKKDSELPKKIIKASLKFFIHYRAMSAGLFESKIQVKFTEKSIIFNKWEFWKIFFYKNDNKFWQVSLAHKFLFSLIRSSIHITEVYKVNTRKKTKNERWPKGSKMCQTIYFFEFSKFAASKRTVLVFFCFKRRVSGGSGV